MATKLNEYEHPRAFSHLRRTSEMATPAENRWKAILGMSSDHAGVNQELGRFQGELYRVLARVDDPRDVRSYIDALRRASFFWLVDYEGTHGKK